MTCETTKGRRRFSIGLGKGSFKEITASVQEIMTTSGFLSIKARYSERGEKSQVAILAHVEYTDLDSPVEASPILISSWPLFVSL